jgi:hypothetical protein
MTDNTSQSAFIQSLFRIDPTQGFVEYVQATKPYHTKILDVLVEYVSVDALNVTITDAIAWEIQLSRPDFDVAYSCGYGFVWDPLPTATTPDLPLAPVTILEATAAIEAPNPGYQNSNSFLIQPASFVPFVVAVASTGSNQLVFCKNYDVNSVDAGASEWIVDDPLNTLPAELSVGDAFFISSDTGATGNGRYTVALVSPNTPAVGFTTVETVEAIPVQANGDGVFHRVFAFSELPVWPAGQAVTLSTTSGTLPTPIITSTRYFFQPQPTAGYFNLSYIRYPTLHTHFVDLTSLGAGEFEIVRDESFIPGTVVVADNTHFGRNNGTYIIRDIVAEGSNERVFVYQKVESSTPLAFLGGDGQLTLNINGFDEPIYCPPTQMPDLYADTFIHESLKFTFEINFSDALDATALENAARGFGDTEWGDAMLGSYGVYADSFDARTAQTSGNFANGDSAHTILPTGIDTQLFDVGGFDETLQTVQHLYGRNVPLP